MVEYEVTITVKQTISAKDQLEAMMKAFKKLPPDGKIQWISMDEVEAD